LDIAVQKPPPTHREVLPIQECRQCGAYLRTGNTSTTCDPCGIPPWEQLDPQEIWDRLPDVNAHYRRHAFEALTEIMEGVPGP
jgi:hypothetical protein